MYVHANHLLMFVFIFSETVTIYFNKHNAKLQGKCVSFNLNPSSTNFGD